MTVLVSPEAKRLARETETPVDLTRVEFLDMAFRIRERVPSLRHCTPTEVMALADELAKEAEQWVHGRSDDDAVDGSSRELGVSGQ